MECGEAQYLLSMREHGEIESQKAGELKKHLAFCTRCRQATEDFEKLDRMLASLAEPEVPDGYWADLPMHLTARLATVRAPGKQRTLVAAIWPICRIAALVLLGALCVRFYMGLRGERARRHAAETQLVEALVTHPMPEAASFDEGALAFSSLTEFAPNASWMFYGDTASGTEISMGMTGSGEDVVLTKPGARQLVFVELWIGENSGDETILVSHARVIALPGQSVRAKVRGLTDDNREFGYDLVPEILPDGHIRLELELTIEQEPRESSGFLRLATRFTIDDRDTPRVSSVAHGRKQYVVVVQGQVRSRNEAPGSASGGIL
ncbi:MAG: hypothetical protein QGD94_08170 [Planctomycetia bacterium]|nr:hypothetical protein [Planctomycetia bacterium]